MVLDTSALLAIMLAEPAAPRLVTAVDGDRTRLVSAATVVEASLVLLGRYGEAGDSQLDRLLQSIGADIVAVDDEQIGFARDAAIRFGRGRHRAALNFGDCFSYALSMARNEPLLFVGADFTHTDVDVCQW
jgi:ribonuclease VapC